MRLILLCVGLPLLLLGCVWYTCCYISEWHDEAKQIKKYREESRNSPWFLP